METNNEENNEEVTTNSFPFDIQTFDFLDKYFKEVNEEFGIKANKIGITCFDVNQNFFVFGTNCGIIYLFRRRINSPQVFKYRLFSVSINVIKLITDELLTFVTESGVYVWNRLSRQFLYGWKTPTKALITCLQTFITDRKLLIFSGDSEGVVRSHDLNECRQITVYNDIGFQITQIDVIDDTTLLISTSFRTVILKLIPKRITSVGKNERKNCGKFGAVFSHKSSLIYGSRPSLHLIKAEISGDVIETLRINNIEESSDCSQIFNEITQKPLTTRNGKYYKLGVLQLFCDDQYIISLNDSNLLIVRTDGNFCMKEKIDKLIDVKVSPNSNEAFLLIESKLIIRIRNNQIINCTDFEVSSEYENSTESEDKSSESKGSNESLFSLFIGPVIANPISFIDEELKKVFDFNAIQNKITKKYNQLSASIISTIDPQILPNSDKNVFVEPEYDDSINTSTDGSNQGVNSSEVPPLVVTRKGRRRTRHNSSDSMVTNNSTTDSVNSNEEIVLNVVNTSSDNRLLNGNSLQNGDTNDDNRLEMILSAYREANHLDDIIQPPIDDYVIDDNQLLNGVQKCVLTDEEESKSDYSSENSKTNELSESISKQNEMDVKSFERFNSFKEVKYCWQQMISSNETKQNISKTFCSNGYNTTTEIGLIWFLSKDNNSLYYYPGFESFRLNKGRAKDITSSTNELYILNESGVIFKREGMDATKPVGTKWTQIKVNKSKFKFSSISLNWKDSILWCCDSNGETWTHQIKTQKWFPIKDFSSHSIEMKKVCVSPIDSTIVWGIDKSGKIFVRSFTKSSDNRNDFCGDEWLLMDGFLAIDIVVCCDNSVLIVMQNNHLLKRSAKIGPKDKINEWKEVNSPEVPADDSIVSLSVTEDNDIMIMTSKGCVWHTFTKNRISAKEDLDWLII